MFPRVFSSDFSGGRFFQPLEGRVADPPACFLLMKSRDRMKALQYVNAESLL
jgi:hypothetical protein